mmetsp:Transcript_131095/g.327070  ORF Transcript_131095/g.327070 Transcript_131095/m.327070 type:complete len:86 (+) Transcript_131095:467-724(+)
MCAQCHALAQAQPSSEPRSAWRQTLADLPLTGVYFKQQPVCSSVAHMGEQGVHARWLLNSECAACMAAKAAVSSIGVCTSLLNCM